MTKLHSRLVRWALGRHLLTTVVAFSRWLWVRMTIPAGSARRDRVLWRAMLIQGASHQRGLQVLRRRADAQRILRRYQRLLRGRVLTAARPLGATV